MLRIFVFSLILFIGGCSYDIGHEENFVYPDIVIRNSLEKQYDALVWYAYAINSKVVFWGPEENEISAISCIVKERYTMLRGDSLEFVFDYVTGSGEEVYETNALVCHKLYIKVDALTPHAWLCGSMQEDLSLLFTSINNPNALNEYEQELLNSIASLQDKNIHINAWLLKQAKKRN